MICKTCGADIPDHARYCSYCSSDPRAELNGAAPKGKRLYDNLCEIQKGLRDACDMALQFYDRWAGKQLEKEGKTYVAGRQMEQHSSLEAPKEYLNIKSGPAIASLLIFAIGLAPCLRMLVICIITYGYMLLSLLECLIAPVVYGIGVLKNNRFLRKAGTVLSFFFFLEMVLEVISAWSSYHQAEDMDFVHTQFAIAAGALVASFPVALLLVKLYNLKIRSENELISARNMEAKEAENKRNLEIKRDIEIKNQKIREKNQAIRERNQVIRERKKADGKELGNKLLEKMGELQREYPWFPIECFNRDVVDKFITILEANDEQVFTMEELLERYRDVYKTEIKRGANPSCLLEEEDIVNSNMVDLAHALCK